MNKDELEVSPPRPRQPLQRNPLNPNIKVPGAPAGGSILGDVLHSAYNGLTHVGHAVHAVGAAGVHAIGRFSNDLGQVGKWLTTPITAGLIAPIEAPKKDDEQSNHRVVY